MKLSYRFSRLALLAACAAFGSTGPAGATEPTLALVPEPFLDITLAISGLALAYLTWRGLRAPKKVEPFPSLAD